MLKKIRVDQVVLGMHIKEFCGSWMEHPFWRTRFVLTDPADIKSIRASSVKEVWIDVSKGRDIAPGEVAILRSESEAYVDAELAKISHSPRTVETVSIAAELERASKICEKSKEAITLMFSESRMGNAIDVKSVGHLVDEISGSVNRNPDALISLARSKTADDYTYMHSVAVCALMMSLAKQLQLDEEETRLASIGGLLHDLGKAVLPMDVLNKPGKLTDEEFAIIKTHPAEGIKLLKLAGNQIDPHVLDIVIHHHEKTDGSGYPDRLEDARISRFAKMAAVCDVYDAITSNRPYKAGWNPAESLRRMAEWTNGHFDARIFHAFVKSLGIYPIGSLVRLNSGRLGIVMEQSQKSLLTPTVKVFFSTRSETRIKPELVDLPHPLCLEKVASVEEPERWKFTNLEQMWAAGFVPT